MKNNLGKIKNRTLYHQGHSQCSFFLDAANWTLNMLELHGFNMSEAAAIFYSLISQLAGFCGLT